MLLMTKWSLFPLHNTASFFVLLHSADIASLLLVSWSQVVYLLVMLIDCVWLIADSETSEAIDESWLCHTKSLAGSWCWEVYSESFYQPCCM